MKLLLNHIKGCRTNKNLIKKNYSYTLRLWDLLNINFSLTMDEIKEIAAYGKQKFTEPSAMALVTQQDLAYGELRVFEIYREEQNARARVFRDREEAVNWLKQQLRTLNTISSILNI